MKKLFLTVAAAALAIAGAYAQDAQSAAAAAAEVLSEAEDVPEAAPKPKYWDLTIQNNINFSQTKLTNWAAGGYNNYALAANVDASANYAKDKMKWTNRLQLDYGFLYSADKPILQKHKDRIYFESNWGYETPVEHLYWSAMFDFKTQFNNNYTYGNPPAPVDPANPTKEEWLAARTIKSGFLTPAYTNLGLGIKWTPKDWLVVNIAPLTGGVVMVEGFGLDTKDIHSLRKTYGMEATGETASVDGEDIDLYKASRFELGAQVKADAKWVVNDVFTYTTQLVLFSNYLKDPQNIRVNWDNKIFWKLAKYFALTLSTNLIYDDTVLVKDTTGDGEVNAPAVQFKEFLEFGFTYTITGKR